MSSSRSCAFAPRRVAELDPAIRDCVFTAEDNPLHRYYTRTVNAWSFTGAG